MDIIDFKSATPDSNSADHILNDLETYWQTLRHAGAIPLRHDIAPGKIEKTLPYAFILQRVAPGTARLRIAGQKLHELLKMDARGMPFTVFFEPQARDHIKTLTETAFTRPAIIGVELISPGSLIRPAAAAKMLLLPLRDSQGQPNRLLGAIVATGTSSTRPRRFSIAADRPIRQDPLGNATAPQQLIPRDPAPARPGLRLVVNNS